MTGTDIGFVSKTSSLCYLEFTTFSPFCFDSAFLTRILLPAISLPLRVFIAALASPGFGISTKPKPLDKPVVLSITSLQDCTVPCASNITRASASVVVRARLRISSFMGLRTGICVLIIPMNKDLVFIDSDLELTQHCRQLRGCAWLAVDTEFERVSTYYPELCLLQMASSGRMTAVIDPLAIAHLEPLYDVLYDPSITKVFHAARQDLEIFFHIKGVLPFPIFDTQIAAALLGYDKQFSYANLINEILGVELAKTQTRTNWKRRPLSRSQLQYAADDVIYLGQVYELLLPRLIEAGKLPLLEEECKTLARPELYQPDPETMWLKIREARKLEGKLLAVLQQLAAWREITARAENQPRKWILQDHTLVEMARVLPTSQDDLSRINGVNERLLKRHGAALLEIIGQGHLSLRQKE